MRARLGDDIDDFCVKCKRVMNHAVVSLVGEEPAKVRCRTCHSDHDYRHEQPPPPKVDSRKAALFNQVLSNVNGTTAGAAVAEVESAPTSVEAVADGALSDGPAADSDGPGAAASADDASMTVTDSSAVKGKGRKKA